MISKLYWLNIICIIQSSCLLSMYKSSKIAQMQVTKTMLITHIRNFQHRLKYKTPEGTIIERNLNGSETYTYPNGKIVKKNPTDVKKEDSTNFELWSFLFKK